jgi:hypothetical protein
MEHNPSPARTHPSFAHQARRLVESAMHPGGAARMGRGQIGSVAPFPDDDVRDIIAKSAANASAQPSQLTIFRADSHQLGITLRRLILAVVRQNHGGDPY